LLRFISFSPVRPKGGDGWSDSVGLQLPPNPFRPPPSHRFRQRLVGRVLVKHRNPHARGRPRPRLCGVSAGRVRFWTSFGNLSAHRSAGWGPVLVAPPPPTPPLTQTCCFLINPLARAFSPNKAAFQSSIFLKGPILTTN